MSSPRDVGYRYNYNEEEEEHYGNHNYSNYHYKEYYGLEEPDESSSLAGVDRAIASHLSRHSDDGDGDDSSYSSVGISPETVMERIEEWIVARGVIDQLDEGQPPSWDSKSFYHATQCRQLTGLLLVASFCHELLSCKRTTTTREVYYYFVTHFRNQAECDKAIWDLTYHLKLSSRFDLGLIASPKGWFCGCLDLYNRQTGDLILNGRTLVDNLHGMAITHGLTNQQRQHHVVVRSHDAKCILVVEKEGVYVRLVEDKFFLRYYPCILVTGKGFPDVATRHWVQHLQKVLRLPVYGLCDCNPYGLSVLHTYSYDGAMPRGRSSGTRHKTHNNRTSTSSSSTTTTAATTSSSSSNIRRRRSDRLDLQWMGLRPSQVAALDLPPNVFQQLTERDQKQLESLLHETHPFHYQQPFAQERIQEIQNFEYKVELEALNWKGMDFLCQWVHRVLIQHEQQQQQQQQQQQEPLMQIHEEGNGNQDSQHFII